MGAAAGGMRGRVRCGVWRLQAPGVAPSLRDCAASMQCRAAAASRAHRVCKGDTTRSTSVHSQQHCQPAQHPPPCHFARHTCHAHARTNTYMHAHSTHSTHTHTAAAAAARRCTCACTCTCAPPVVARRLRLPARGGGRLQGRACALLRRRAAQPRRRAGLPGRPAGRRRLRRRVQARRGAVFDGSCVAAWLSCAELRRARVSASLRGG